MKLLKEVLARVRRLDPVDQDDDVPFDDLDSTGEMDDVPPEDDVPFDELDSAGDVPPEDDVSFDDPDSTGDVPQGDQETDELDEFGDDSDPADEHPELDGIADQAAEDPDRQGLIRTVKNAHLVYKRDTEDGTFEELWLYNVSNMRDELEAKKAILAGTDIPTNKMQSPDGSQTYEIWAAGNAEMILIKGLPN